MQVVDRVFKVLELLSKSRNGMAITDIKERADLPISTTHRILSSLIENEYVYQDKDSKRYKLSSKIVSLSSLYLRDDNLINNSKVYIDKLFDKYEETIFLSKRETKQTVCVYTKNSYNGVMFYAKVGSIMPLNASSAAQVIYAYDDIENIDKCLDLEGLNDFTKNTIISKDALLDKLDDIKEKGYGICDEELDDGVIAVSAPIKNINDQVDSSLTMIWIKKTDKDISSIINDVVKTADLISISRGWIKPY